MIEEDRRRQALKTLLQLVCQLLWVMGLVVGLTAFYLLMMYKQISLFLSDSYITLPAIFTLASALFLLVSGALGSWLSIRDSTCLHGLFIYLLVVVFCLQSTASALAYFHETKLDSNLAPLTGVFQNYTGSSRDLDSQAVDATQEKLQCCGVHGYRDWLETTWFNRTGGMQVPHTCCNSTFPSCNGTVDLPWQLYTQGCQVKLQISLQFVLMLIIFGFPLVLMLEVVLILTEAQLMKHQQQINYQVLRTKY